MKRIALLGSTGSIGTQTLEVVRAHPSSFTIEALAAGQNAEKIAAQVAEFQPKVISVADDKTREKLKQLLDQPPEIFTGAEGLTAVSTAPDADFVMNAVIGSVGLAPTLEAMKCGKTIGIANKETLVTAGHLVMEAARTYNVDLLPVDSEHSAIFQCLQGSSASDVSRLILTASGGTFRDKARADLEGVTVEDALKHPNWSMGAKITIDSATMMNKGLEVIEAHWLFDIPYDQIDVVLHRESIVHSFVEYKDGSMICELGHPDMRQPIQYALTYPKRLEFAEKKKLNLWETGALHFEKMDQHRFHALKLAYDAGREGGSMPTVLNAANEAAVAMFLDGRISFLAIEEAIEAALNRHERITAPDLATIQAVDEETRAYVNRLMK
ncbi:1-deoxy-D-xylulose 5-phosphate reductoisomerase [Salsuginibacillus halophilus]|uniref:1-deoxy-D-xylulose 5-phosphate reductoisomerase n=1 Tax=Salsuginibacillus halophilus TaxID=517424 RepID=A0A2P8HYE0_9BACI|nr:1-deoxy-D-xylulose-5-phosphate reductoisomerase [Salsuginibacillus halophilus]PSL51223.1 1-deoxy-D-xylulose 5-phosphate reductoisomerase [Salsuginibacillus halophilus]